MRTRDLALEQESHCEASGCSARLQAMLTSSKAGNSRAISKASLAEMVEPRTLEKLGLSYSIDTAQPENNATMSSE